MTDRSVTKHQRYTAFCGRLRELAKGTDRVVYKQTLQEAAAVIDGLLKELDTMAEVARLTIHPPPSKPCAHLELRLDPEDGVYFCPEPRCGFQIKPPRETVT